MVKKCEHQAIVITGASSGIGRATALELAKRGALLVLAARSKEDLVETADEIRKVGGRAYIVPCDVSHYEEVELLGNEAVRLCGRIDTWINNAAVSAYGTVEET